MSFSQQSEELASTVQNSDDDNEKESIKNGENLSLHNNNHDHDNNSDANNDNIFDNDSGSVFRDYIDDEEIF